MKTTFEMKCPSCKEEVYVDIKLWQMRTFKVNNPDGATATPLPYKPRRRRKKK